MVQCSASPNSAAKAWFLSMTLHVVPISTAPHTCPQCDLLKTKNACDDLLLEHRVINALQIILWAIEVNNLECIKSQVRAIVNALPKG